ncbi:MAG: GntR family transcriptional regulator [Candidatus Binatia bacterium]|nr:GntR family transcriptional regulator [Candidatus Binatia bacterium]
MPAQVVEARLFRPAQRRRLHEEVANQLRDAILEGHYRAGDKLPPERELAARFRVNRTSVREAIKMLESSGLVVARQGDGVIVQPLVEASLDLIAPMIFRGGHIDVGLLREMQEVVSVLLYEMARVAVERVAPEHLKTLRHWRDRLADSTLQREERFAAAREIMVLVADVTGNRVWQMVARRLRMLLASAPLQETRERLHLDPTPLVRVIDACMDAIEQGKPKDAVARLREAFRMLGESSVGPHLAASVPEQRPSRRKTV